MPEWLSPMRLDRDAALSINRREAPTPVDHSPSAQAALTSTFRSCGPACDGGAFQSGVLFPTETGTPKDRYYPRRGCELPSSRCAPHLPCGFQCADCGWSGSWDGPDGECASPLICHQPCRPAGVPGWCKRVLADLAAAQRRSAAGTGVDNREWPVPDPF